MAECSSSESDTLDYLLGDDDDENEQPCMDIDDINVLDVPAPDVLTPREDDEPTVRPSDVILSDVLRRGETAGNNWTHLVREPGPFRCQVTDMQAAGELYRAVWRYADAGLCVMERRLSPITRCSIALRLSAGHLPASYRAQREFVRLAVRTITSDLRDALHTQLPASALFCVVLMPHGVDRCGGLAVPPSTSRSRRSGCTGPRWRFPTAN